MAADAEFDMKPVSSSQISEIGYHAESGRLRIRFADRRAGTGEAVPGAVYEYADVPAEVHAALMAADSKGSHFHRHIKLGNFSFQKI